MKNDVFCYCHAGVGSGSDAVFEGYCRSVENVARLSLPKLRTMLRP